MLSDLNSEVVVVGGGISGLVTAWRLREAGIDVRLLEAGDEVGGCLRTERRDGFILEKGPFNVLVKDDAFHDLLDASEVDVRQISASEASKARFVLHHGALRAVPTGPGPLIRTKLLSGRAKLRLLRGLLYSRPASNGESSIAEAATRRFGPEVADTFVSSLVAGIFGGDSAQLSLDACFPAAARFDRAARSPLLRGIGMLKARKRARREAEQAGIEPRPKRGLVSFEKGLQSLPEWLAGQLGERVHRSCVVEELWKEGERFALRVRNGETSPVITAGRVVLATPLGISRRLADTVAPRVSRALDGTPCASLVVINLAYPSAKVTHPMSGYGFLVPADEPTPIMGVLWADSAFPHHAPDDQRLIRVFMGGPRDPHACQREDSELIQTVRDSVNALLGIECEPTLVDICRWPNAIPQYHRGHLERLERVEAALNETPGLYMTGNALRGVSINDCVRDGATVADLIADSMKIEQPSDKLMAGRSIHG